MRQVDPKVYNKDYYLNVCLGSEEFKKGKNILNPRWMDILKKINIKKRAKVLDLGCGRGEVAFYLAKKGAKVVGVDYSEDAIKIANGQLKKNPLQLNKNVQFLKNDAKKIDFPKDSFDLIIAFDFFEHLYKEELEKVMEKVSLMLKKDGMLVVHTEVNKIYLDYTHKFFSYPISSFFVFINNKIFNKNYQNLPKDPRNKYHKVQHVNEPTIFYLESLFSNFGFKGKIIQHVGILKPVFKWKDRIYNAFVCLYPLSLFFPLNIFFATDYICIMRNKKK